MAFKTVAEQSSTAAKVAGNKNADLFKELEDAVKNAYESSITMEDAEKLAAGFLHGMFTVTAELAVAELDARMKKTGVKAIKAAVYIEKATEGDKKPSDAFLEAYVNSDKRVRAEQEGLDKAEVLADGMRNYYNIFREAHIYMRGIAKGTNG